MALRYIFIEDRIYYKYNRNGQLYLPVVIENFLQKVI